MLGFVSFNSLLCGFVIPLTASLRTVRLSAQS